MPGLWPEGKQAAAFFSFDVDCEAPLLYADQRNADMPVTMSQANYGSKYGLYEILRVFRKREVPVTFFVPTATAEMYPDMLKTIVDEGHEIGLHGHLHEPPYKMTPKEEADILEKTTEILERMTGVRPVGYRAPMAEVNPTTPKLLADFGIGYDSSYMGEVFPYYHEFDDGTEPLVELPIHWTTDDWSYSMMAPNALGDAAETNVVRPAAEMETIWTDVRAGVLEMGGLYTPAGHPEVAGRPNRIGVIDSVVASTKEDDRFWIANGRDIAAWWRTSGAKAPTGLDRLNR